MAKKVKTFRNAEKIDNFMIAASRVMAKNGYAQMSMRDIARETGVNKSLLYYYFKNKDELFRELFKFLNKRYINIITEVTNLPISPSKKMETGFQEFQEFVRMKPKWILMVLDLMVQEVQKPDSKKEIVLLYNHLMDLISKTLYEGKDNGIFNKEFDEQAISSLILSTLMGLGIFHVMDEDLIDFPRTCEYFLNILNQNCSI